MAVALHALVQPEVGQARRALRLGMREDPRAEMPRRRHRLGADARGEDEIQAFVLAAQPLHGGVAARELRPDAKRDRGLLVVVRIAGEDRCW